MPTTIAHTLRHRTDTDTDVAAFTGTTLYGLNQVGCIGLLDHISAYAAPPRRFATLPRNNIILVISESTIITLLQTSHHIDEVFSRLTRLKLAFALIQRLIASLSAGEILAEVASHRTWVETHRDSRHRPKLQLLAQRLDQLVQSSLARTVAVPATLIVVSNTSHSGTQTCDHAEISRKHAFS